MIFPILLSAASGHRSVLGIMVIMLSLVASLSQAQEQDTLTRSNSPAAIDLSQMSFEASPDTTPDDLPAGSNSAISFLDRPQQYVSSGLNKFTKGVDEFFSDEKVEYESNKSFIRLTGDIIFSEGGEVGFDGRTKAKVDLPNTSQKWKLVLQSDPAEEHEDIEQNPQDDPLDAAEDTSFFAGVEGLWDEFQNWKLRSSIGLRLSSSLDLYVRFRANRDYPISDDWRAHLRNTLYHFTNSGYGFRSSLEFDHKLTDDMLFRASTDARWEEENQFWDLSEIFSLAHTLSPDKAIIYEAGVFGISEPTVFATNYLLQARYRRLVHSDYLFLELVPRITYEKDNDFEAGHSLTVRTEIVFKG